MPTLTFKVTEEQARMIRLRAQRESISVSEYLRRRARVPEAVATKPTKVRCTHTRAMIFAPVEGQPPLTTDVVRYLLANFP